MAFRSDVATKLIWPSPADKAEDLARLSPCQATALAEEATDQHSRVDVAHTATSLAVYTSNRRWYQAADLVTGVERLVDLAEARNNSGSSGIWLKVDENGHVEGFGWGEAAEELWEQVRVGDRWIEVTDSFLAVDASDPLLDACPPTAAPPLDGPTR